MKELRRVKNIVVLSVDDISDDYREAIQALHGLDVQITNDSRRCTDYNSLNEMVNTGINHRDTALYVSTSTMDAICMLTLANMGRTFGIFQHSPTDGALLKLFFQQNGRLIEAWNPAEGVSKEAIAA